MNKLNDITSLFDTTNILNIENFYIDSNDTILKYLLNKINLKSRSLCQFISGHKGSGKTAFLNKLKIELENQNYFVVYCDMKTLINIYDFNYVDLMLALLKKTTEVLADKEIYLYYTSLGNINLSELKDMIPFKTLDFNLKFSMISDYIKYSDFLKSKVRYVFDAQAITFLSSIKEVLNQIKIKLNNNNYKDLIIIIDGLDHIVMPNKNDPDNLEQILFNKSMFLKEIDTDLIINLPLYYYFSANSNNLCNHWQESLLYFPVSRHTNNNETAVEASYHFLTDVIKKRLSSVKKDIASVFSDEYLNKALYYSAGNTGQLFKIIYESLIIKNSLPLEADDIYEPVKLLKHDLIRSVSADKLQQLITLAENPEQFDPVNNSDLLNKGFIFYYPDQKIQFILNPVLKDF
ncbi:MAG: P-loop NTPase fold protein [Cyanobacteriota bacterium]